MTRKNRSLLFLCCVLAAAAGLYFATGGHILSALTGFLAVIIFIMADMLSVINKGVAVSGQSSRLGKKRSLIVVGILGTLTAVGLVTLIIAYFSGIVQFT